MTRDMTRDNTAQKLAAAVSSCRADYLRALAERRAAIVAVAVERGDSEAAKEFGVSRQLVCRYRLAAANGDR